MKPQLAELLLKFSYPAHYQLVYTNSREPLFSLINYAPKGHVLQDEMYGFTVQKVTSHKPYGKHATKEPHYQVVPHAAIRYHKRVFAPYAVCSFSVFASITINFKTPHAPPRVC